MLIDLAKAKRIDGKKVGGLIFTPVTIPANSVVHLFVEMCEPGILSLNLSRAAVVPKKSIQSKRIVQFQQIQLGCSSLDQKLLSLLVRQIQSSSCAQPGSATWPWIWPAWPALRSWVDTIAVLPLSSRT